MNSQEDYILNIEELKKQADSQYEKKQKYKKSILNDKEIINKHLEDVKKDFRFYFENNNFNNISFEPLPDYSNQSFEGYAHYQNTTITLTYDYPSNLEVGNIFIFILKINDNDEKSIKIFKSKENTTHYFYEKNNSKSNVFNKFYDVLTDLFNQSYNIYFYTHLSV